MGHTDSLGQTAENLVREYAIVREEQDRFALHSHVKAVAAADAGRFDAELLGRRGARPARDGHGRRRRGPAPRFLAAVARAVAPGVRAAGTVTAGNSSTLNDGAVALLLASEDFAAAHGLEPLARVRSAAVAGVAPRIMGIGPVPAAEKPLAPRRALDARHRPREVNEAFAAQVLAVLRRWAGPQDARLNVNGGAIALGHPLGASGARIVTTTAHELCRRDAQFALVSMCIGVGQVIALVLDAAESHRPPAEAGQSRRCVSHAETARRRRRSRGPTEHRVPDVVFARCSPDSGPSTADAHRHRRERPRAEHGSPEPDGVRAVIDDPQPDHGEQLARPRTATRRRRHVDGERERRDAPAREEQTHAGIVAAATRGSRTRAKWRVALRCPCATSHASRVMADRSVARLAAKLDAASAIAAARGPNRAPIAQMPTVCGDTCSGAAAPACLRSSSGAEVPYPCRWRANSLTERRGACWTCALGS